MVSELYAPFQEYSNKVVKDHRPELQNVISAVLEADYGPYKNDEPFYWPGTIGPVRPGNKPFFNSTENDRSPITPFGSPNFINFPNFIGKIQSLNSVGLWEKF